MNDISKQIKCTVDTVGYSQKPTGAATAVIQKRFKENPAIHLQEMTAIELLYKVGEDGYSFKPAVFHEGSTGNDHFKELHIIAIDIDTVEGWSISHTQDRLKLYNLDYVGIYKSFSYTEEKQKHRIIFELPEVINDRRMVSLLYLLFMQVLPSDKQCIDTARLYFGGKGVIEGTNKPLNLANLYTAFISEVDKLQAYQKTRVLQDIGSKVGLNTVNGAVLDISIQENNIVPNWTMQNITLKKRGRKGTAYEDVDKSYSPQSITAKYGYEDVPIEGLSDCKLFKEFETGNHWLYHGELFYLVTNLYTFKSVVERMTNSIGQYPNKNQLHSKLKTAVVQSAKAEYIPQLCSNIVWGEGGEHTNCKYFEQCQIAKNYISLYDYLKNSRMNNIEYLGAEPTQRQSVEQVRVKTQETFKTIIEEMVESKDGLYVLKSPTGVGKTEILTSFDWSALGSKRVAFAMPTHKLKDEYVLRCEGKELYVWAKPQMVAFENEVQKEIDLLFSKKLYKEAKKLYFKELKKHIADKNSPLHEACRAYEHDLRNLAGQNLVATTHRDVLMNPEGYDLIIYDEDIIWSSLEQSSISIKTFETVVNMVYSYFDGKAIPEITQALKQFLDSENKTLDLTGLTLTEDEQQYIQSLHSITTRVMDIAIMGIYTADYILKGADGIIYGKRAGLSYKPSLVLSATANEAVYKAVSPEVKFYDMGQAHEGGRLVQYLDKSYSRSYIRNMSKAHESLDKVVNDICDTLESQGKSMMDYTILTYSPDSEPEFITALKNVCLNVDKQTYFGNCSGYDHLGGKNMVVLGTPNYPVDSYRMMGLLIFGNTFDVMSEFSTGKNEVNGFKKKYATFKDSTLQLVQQYVVETELSQAVGRARLLNNNEAQVLLLSGFPLNESSVVHYSGKTIIK